MPGTLRQAGFLYLLHWQDRRGRVEHYIGWTTDLEARLKQHFSECGGCPTTRGYRREGMGGRLVRVWKGTMQGERRLQQSLTFPPDCPVCAGRAVGDVACEGWIDTQGSRTERHQACLPGQATGQDCPLLGEMR